MGIGELYRDAITLSESSKNFMRPYIGTRENQNGVAHPNRITFYGFVLHAAGLTLLSSPVTAPVGLALLGVGVGCDVADGEIARQFELCSKQGAKLDPLFDKLKDVNFVAAATMFGSLANPVLAAGCAVSLAGNYISQRQRGNLSKQFKEAYDVIENPNNSELDNLETRITSDSMKKQEKNLFQANIFGKAKTFLESTVHLAYGVTIVAPETFSEYTSNIETTLGITLAVSAVCGSVGVYQRFKKSKGILFPNN